MKIIESRKENIFKFIDRIRSSYFSKNLQRRVEKIIETVRSEGDDAIIHYTEKFDGVKLEKKDIFVNTAKLYEIGNSLDLRYKKAIDKAAERIFSFHNKVKLKSMPIVTSEGSYLIQTVRPLRRAGIYVPGGTAPLVSSVLMNAIPALCAGVKEIYISTPPAAGQAQRVSPAIAYAAAKANVSGLYLIGGAQAIAAYAYGTKIVKKVDKIVGPGNIYVTLAKKLVYGAVDIDMIAGPSEVLVLSDGTGKPDYIASDLLAQLEHDKMASAFFVTDNFLLLKNVEKEIKRQMQGLKRQEILKKSINNCCLIYVKDMDEGVKVSNLIAPEHLEILSQDAFAIAKKIENAGALFIGGYSVESIGDYVAGPNHTLPTSGSAVYFSPLSTYDFYKRMSLINITRDEFFEIRDAALTLSELEGLDAHNKSIKVRV